MVAVVGVPKLNLSKYCLSVDSFAYNHKMNNGQTMGKEGMNGETVMLKMKHEVPVREMKKIE